MTSPASARGRRVGCAVGSGSPTGECSAASCRRSATGRCISDCCTPSRTGWSSSPPAPDGTGRFTSTRVRVPTTSCPVAAPARPDGSRRCSRSRPSTRIATRSCSAHPRSAHSRAARSTPSRTPGRCGSTSTSPDSCITCGRCSPSGPATCSSRAAAGARTPTGYSTSRSRQPMRTSPRACGQIRSSARTRGSSTASASTSTADRTSPTSHAKTEAGSCASAAR